MPLKLSGSSSSSIQPWKCLRFNPHWIPVWEITLYWMLQNLADLPNISWIVNYTSLCLGVVYYPLSFHSLWFPPQMFRSKRTTRQQLVLENDMSSCFPLCPPWNPIYPGPHEVALPQIHYPSRIIICGWMLQNTSSILTEFLQLYYKQCSLAVGSLFGK